MDEKKKIILIADDVKINRMILKKALDREYDIMEAADGEETLRTIVDNYKKLSAVLLDINMPRINGFQVMNVLNKKNAMKYLPIILITGEDTAENRRKGYEYGAVEFISKPFDILAVKSCIANVVKLYDEKNRMEITIAQQNRELKEQAEKLRKLNTNIMDLLGSVVEFRGSDNNAHIKRVKAFTKVLGQAIMKHAPHYHIGENEVALITAASCLHDIGKMMIPDTILLKPSKLSDDEYEIIKSHTTKGCEMLEAMADYQEPLYYKYSYEICRYHHERYDGSGYPEHLKGDAIPISAQIVSITEAFDALMSNSIYKERMEFDEAYRMILEGECGMFSPDILQCFKISKELLKEIDEKYYDSNMD